MLQATLPLVSFFWNRGPSLLAFLLEKPLSCLLSHRGFFDTVCICHWSPTMSQRQKKKRSGVFPCLDPVLNVAPHLQPFPVALSSVADPSSTISVPGSKMGLWAMTQASSHPRAPSSPPPCMPHTVARRILVTSLRNL